MGVLRALFTGQADPVISAAIEPTAASFAVDATSIDAAVFGLSSYTAPTNPAPRIDRRSAIQVPAVKRVRDLIAGSLGSLPIDLYNANRQSVRWNLMLQPEADKPRVVTMTRTIEDLLFEGIAWWRITQFGWHNYPTQVRRIDPRLVTVNEADGQVYVDGKPVPDAELIRFDSPNDPLLVAGARAIRTCLSLDAAAQRYADEPMPLGYFRPADGVDPAEDEDIVALLDQWKTARQTRATGYVPASLEYQTAAFTPEQMQMADARQHAVLEIARVAGVDPEELGVSTTSRTYANQFDRRKAFLDFTLGAYRQAVEDRLAMGDVTPMGYYALFNFSAFLRTDDLTRYQTYKVGLEVGAIADKAEVRELEGKNPVRTTTDPTNAEVTVEANQPAAAQTFGDNEPEIRLDAPGAQAFEVDVEKRTVKGLLVPYGVPARSKGQWWQFAQGTLKYSAVNRVKLWIQHDQNKAVGVATELDDRDDGLYGTFRVARGAAGDEALSYAEDGVLDGFSIGLGQGGKFKRDSKTGVNHAIEAPLMETSLTPAPSFDDARVHAVAASAAGKEPTVGDDNSTEPVDFSAITEAINTGFQNLMQAPQIAERQTIPAGGSVQVNEELPYRFDGISGEHSFSADLRAMASGDAEARQRLDTFMDEAFAVTSGNVGSLNPTQNRPELYVPNLEFSRPLWDLVSNGSIEDKTPFTVPKFASATIAVGPHTEGVEPTPGAFTATNQTITPTPISGKIEINREVWDQGGSPQADQIIWAEMLNGYYEGLETRIAQALEAVGTAEINLASAVDEALVDALQNVLADLQFTRGGNRFTSLALDKLLFRNLLNASDTSGRKLLPVVNPQNAQGSVDGAFSAVAIGAQTGRAAWALNRAGVVDNAARSFLFVPSSVWAWASAPKRFTFEYQVKSIDMAVWGYSATAVLRDSDVKPIDYTTADV